MDGGEERNDSGEVEKEVHLTIRLLVLAQHQRI